MVLKLLILNVLKLKVQQILKILKDNQQNYGIFSRCSDSEAMLEGLEIERARKQRAADRRPSQSPPFIYLFIHLFTHLILIFIYLLLFSSPYFSSALLYRNTCRFKSWKTFQIRLSGVCVDNVSASQIHCSF